MHSYKRYFSCRDVEHSVVVSVFLPARSLGNECIFCQNVKKSCDKNKCKKYRLHFFLDVGPETLNKKSLIYDMPCVLVVSYFEFYGITIKVNKTTSVCVF